MKGVLSGKTHTGYSHGAAGIADALLDLYDATGDEGYAAVAGRAATWLARIAMSATQGAAGLEWPVADGGEPVGPFWCHGAGGVARFFLHAARCDLVPGAVAIAEAAAHTVITGGRACGPTRCHGLAGSIELLLDLQRATGNEDYAVEARRFGRLLLAFMVSDNGAVRWASDQPGSIEPGYMVGSAGVALALARLAEPRRSHQLSLEGMRLTPGTSADAEHGRAG